jgi:tetratricopeptide (TPR) repeat protein
MLFRKVFLAAVMLAVTPAVAQFPDKFTNLQVLPKDIPKAELMSTMRRFAFALDVRCEHCHVQKANDTVDFAADDKDTKKTARIMLQMVAAINREYVGKIGKTTAVQVECATCHHGVKQPRTLNSLLGETIDKQGVPAAIAAYRDLRAKYYGTGAYDFRETSLNQLTESLLAREKNKEAVAIMELNFAVNAPTSLWSLHLLAMSHWANGELDKARDDFRRIIELHPEDGWAKKQLDSLSGTK